MIYLVYKCELDFFGIFRNVLRRVTVCFLNKLRDISFRYQEIYEEVLLLRIIGLWCQDIILSTVIRLTWVNLRDWNLLLSKMYLSHKPSFHILQDFHIFTLFVDTNCDAQVRLDLPFAWRLVHNDPRFSQLFLTQKFKCRLLKVM